MTTAGRPTIGPKTPINIPQADLDRLTTLAVEHGTTRAEQIRTAITNHLGPDTTDPRISERVADAHANAWTWWPRSGHASDLPQWGNQMAHAIWQANAIISMHSDGWDPDLSPVWEVIAAAENVEDGIYETGPDWSEVLWRFARLVDNHGDDLGGHVVVGVDCVSWTLWVRTGINPFSAMLPATYTWGVSPVSTNGWSTMGARIDVDGRDGWSTAGRLIIHALYSHSWEPSTRSWEVDAPLVEQAVEIMRNARLSEESIAMVVSRWEQVRWEEADRRVGGWACQPLRSDQDLHEWCERHGHPTEHLDEWGEAAGVAKKKARATYQRAVQADLDRLASEEYEAAEEAEAARRAAEEAEMRGLRRPATFTPEPEPEAEDEQVPSEEPLEEWERELLEGKRSEQ